MDKAERERIAERRKHYHARFQSKSLLPDWLNAYLDAESDYLHDTGTLLQALKAAEGAIERPEKELEDLRVMDSVLEFNLSLAEETAHNTHLENVSLEAQVARLTTERDEAVRQRDEAIQLWNPQAI